MICSQNSLCNLDAEFRPRLVSERKCKSEHIHFPEAQDLMKLHDCAISFHYWKITGFFPLLAHSPLFLSQNTFALLLFPPSFKFSEFVVVFWILPVFYLSFLILYFPLRNQRKISFLVLTKNKTEKTFTFKLLDKAFWVQSLGKLWTRSILDPTLSKY